MQKQSILRTVGALALSLLLFGACSDDKGGGMRACPTDAAGKVVGLGVIAFDGVEPGKQIEEAFLYNCSEPQICPDQGSPYVPSFVVDPSKAAYGISLGLTNCSTGNNKLVIEKVVIAGDPRCSFTDASIEGKDIAPGKGNTTFVKVDWFPKTVGQDYGAMWVYSNAQNFNPLKVPFCGNAIAQAPDGGVVVQPDLGAYTEAGLSIWKCPEAKTVNASCPHQE